MSNLSGCKSIQMLEVKGNLVNVNTYVDGNGQAEPNELVILIGNLELTAKT